MKKDFKFLFNDHNYMYGTAVLENRFFKNTNFCETPFHS